MGANDRVSSRIGLSRVLLSTPVLVPSCVCGRAPPSAHAIARRRDYRVLSATREVEDIPVRGPAAALRPVDRVVSSCRCHGCTARQSRTHSVPSFMYVECRHRDVRAQAGSALDDGWRGEGWAD